MFTDSSCALRILCESCILYGRAWSPSGNWYTHNENTILNGGSPGRGGEAFSKVHICRGGDVWPAQKHSGMCTHERSFWVFAK